MTLVILAALVLVPVLLVLIFNQHERNLEHLERMKALEAGVVLPKPSSRPTWQCLLIGAGVPFVAFLCANAMSSPYSGGHWESVAAVALLGTIPSTILMLRLPASHQASDRHAEFNHKPLMDADALDVVSRRG